LLKLIPVVAIVLVIQAVVALPFVWDPAAYALGFKMGAQTSPMEYLEYSKLADYLIALTSSNQSTQYWFRESLDFGNYLQTSMLQVNVYYFFLRQGVLVRCLNNLKMGYLKDVVKRKDILILMALFFITCQIVPRE
jgi:hypothetical protein